jgi:hypothetical protein
MRRSMIPCHAELAVLPQSAVNLCDRASVRIQGRVAVATIDGQLVLYNTQPKLELYRTQQALGLITAISVGDVLNCSNDVMVVVTAEGNGFVLNAQLEIMYRFMVPANVVSLGIEDVDRDGRLEVLMGLHNCALHAIRLSVADGKIVTEQVLGDPMITLPAQTWSVHRFGEQLVLNMGFQTVSIDPCEKSTQVMPSFGLHSICVVTRNDAELLIRFAANSKVEVQNIKGEIVWNENLEGTLMISQDVTVQGKKLIILCALEGIAWIIDEDWNIFQLNLGEIVLSLLAFEDYGALTLFYVTISRKVVVLSGIKVQDY